MAEGYVPTIYDIYDLVPNGIQWFTAVPMIFGAHSYIFIPMDSFLLAKKTYTASDIKSMGVVGTVDLMPYIKVVDSSNMNGLKVELNYDLSNYKGYLCYATIEIP